MASARSVWLTRLAIRRADEAKISSRSTSPFSRRVRPVATRSTMPWASPTSGASSTEPLTFTTSAWRPVAVKWAAAVTGYLVATRTAPRCSSAAGVGSSPAEVA